MADKPTNHPAAASPVRPAKTPTAQRALANTNRWSTRMLVTIALLCAISVLLTFVEFPLLPGVAWLSYDASFMPAMVCGFAYGPAAGLACGVISVVAHGILFADFTGALMNFLVVIGYILPAALVYQRIHNIKGAVIGLVLGIVVAVAMAVAGWYMLKGRHAEFAMKTMRIAAVVGIVTSCAMIVFAHASAVVVWEEQPTKLAMMEGMYDSEVPPLYAVGIVDEETQEVIAPFAIPGGTSFLATGNFETEYPGLNELAQTEEYGDMVVEDMPVNLVFQSYHLMVAMYGLIMLTSILVLVFTFRGGRIAKMRWLQWAAVLSPIWPFIAIQTGWITAEVGRQPWVVYPSVTGPEGVSLLTADGISMSVSAPELWLTLALFVLVYAVLLVGWARVIGRFIKEGPVEGGDDVLDRQLDEAAPAAAAAGDAVERGGE